MGMTLRVTPNLTVINGYLGSSCNLLLDEALTDDPNPQMLTPFRGYPGVSQEKVHVPWEGLSQ
jgi:hypothetical protein